MYVCMYVCMYVFMYVCMYSVCTVRVCMYVYGIDGMQFGFMKGKKITDSI